MGEKALDQQDCSIQLDGSANSAPETIKLEEGQVLGKNEHGTKGMKDYNIDMETTTKGLDPKLGIAKPFNSSLEGEMEEGDQTKHQGFNMRTSRISPS